MTIAQGTVPFESDGKSVTVTLDYSIDPNKPALVDSWLGLPTKSGDSGDVVTLSIDQREYQFPIPDAINPAIGNTLYVTLASVTEHTIPDGAYSLSSGAGKVALCKFTSTRYGSSGAYYANGILLPEGV